MRGLLRYAPEAASSSRPTEQSPRITRIETNRSCSFDQFEAIATSVRLSKLVQASTALATNRFLDWLLTLLGRILTVVLNDEPVIERQAIPGITGGALDSDEEKAGPILLQGDHGRVEFKELTLTPAQ